METSDSRLTEHRHLLSKCRSQEKKSHPQRQGDGINEYIHGKQSSKKVLKVRKYYYLYNVSDPMIWNEHIDESVFALSFQENVVVFNESKDKRQHRSSVFACVYSTPNDTGVGIVSVYSYSGSTTTFLKISYETAKPEIISIMIPYQIVFVY